MHPKQDTPFWDFLQAIVGAIIFLFLSSYSILSTQNLIQRGDGSSVRLTFDVFWQLLDLPQGKYAGMQAIAIVMSFFLWFCYVGIAFGFETYKQRLEAKKKGAGETFITLIGILLAVDGYATWKSLEKTGWEWYWQLVVAIGIVVGIMYLGHYSIVNFIYGWKGFKGEK